MQCNEKMTDCPVHCLTSPMVWHKQHVMLYLSPEINIQHLHSRGVSLVTVRSFAERRHHCLAVGLFAGTSLAVCEAHKSRKLGHELLPRQKGGNVCNNVE